MSRDYAMSRVHDAIEKSEGNHMKAQRLLLDWITKDQTLLLGLVEPHIVSIVSHAVNHGLATPEGKKTHMPEKVDMPEIPTTQASQRHIDAINVIVNAGSKKTDK